jgi:hypothetical protein
LPESIKRGGGKSLSLTGKASGPPADSWNDAPGKRGTENRESEDGRSGKMRWALLPLYTFGPGEKFSPEPPSYGAQAGAAQESQGWSEAWRNGKQSVP